MTLSSNVTDWRGRPLGTTAEVGDIVTSRWSSAGVKWQVTALVPGRNQFDPMRLDLQSLSSKRTDRRLATEVVVVERASGPQWDAT